jgi:hypothetical protein
MEASGISLLAIDGPGTRESHSSVASEGLLLWFAEAANVV